MTAQVVEFRSKSIKAMVDEIHKQFATAGEGSKRADRARIRAGQLLIALRARIEAGEVGENVNWWKWYDENFARSKRDAMKVMKQARATDPDAAAEDEREAARKRMAKRRAANVRDQSEVDGNLVSHALRLVEEMDANQRRQFFAELRKLHAY